MNYDQLIYDTAIRNGFTPTSAKFVVGQSRHETANYTSPVFKRTNNLFGMKFVNQKLAITDNKKSPEGDYYARYRSPQDSADDAIGRLFNITMRGVSPNQLKNAKTPEEYSNLQKQRGYFGDRVEIYINGIKNAFKKLDIVEMAKGVVKTSKGQFVIGLTLVGVGLLIYYKLFKIKTY